MSHPVLAALALILVLAMLIGRAITGNWRETPVGALAALFTVCAGFAAAVAALVLFIIALAVPISILTVAAAIAYWLLKHS